LCAAEASATPTQSRGGCSEGSLELPVPEKQGWKLPCVKQEHRCTIRLRMAVLDLLYNYLFVSSEELKLTACS